MKYIIERPNSEQPFLESHCQAPLWKNKRSDAKEFDSKESAEKCCKFWRINKEYIKPA